MGRLHNKRLALLFCFLLLAPCAVGQDLGLDSLEQGLEQLLELKLITATQKEQRAAEAPAVISYLTAEQIRDLGVTSVSQALAFLPGIIVSESYFGYTMVTLRGVLQTHYNNKVLLMINGHPMREVVNGSYHLEVLPVEIIERIEVIRGPGSSLYGTNAFAGVINIITRRGGSLEKVTGRMGGGSNEAVEAAMAFGKKWSDSEIAFSAEVVHQGGYSTWIEADEKGESGSLSLENHVSSIWTEYIVSDLIFSCAYFEQRKGKYGITPVLAYTGDNEYRGGFVDARWNRAVVTDLLSLQARLRFDMLDREFALGHFPYDGFAGHENADTIMDSGGNLFGAELQADYSPKEWLSILAGVVYEYAHSEPYVFLFRDDNSTHPHSPYTGIKNSYDLSYFGQALIDAGDRLDIVFGIRYNHNSDSGSSLVPRLGAVAMLAEGIYIKAMYAEAYRSPDFFEKNVETYNVLYGNRSLKPEKVRSYDCALDATIHQTLNLRVNVFYLETRDLVTRGPTSDPDFTGPNAAEYVNSGGDNITGVEAGLVTPLGKKATLHVSYSYTESRSDETDDLNQFVPYSIASAFCQANITPKFSLIPQIEYMADRGEADAYTLLHATARLALSREMHVSLIGRNLLDVDYDSPEYIRNIIDTIPGGPGRSVTLRLDWRF